MSMISASSSVSSQISKSRAISAKQWMFYKFSSNWEYILITIGCTFTIHNFFAFSVMDGGPDEPTIIHHIICFLLVGLPLNYMQILLGQYSQLGVIFFKHLSPLGHGVGYALILNSLVWCTNCGVAMADVLMYLLACVDTMLEWMVCPPNTEERCWDINSKCRNNCITEKVESSTYVYWKETYMDNPDLNPKHLTLGKPLWIRVVPLCLMWGIIFGIVSMGTAEYKKIIRLNLYVASIFVVTVILVFFIADGAAAGVALMFRINMNSFVSAAAWSYAVDRAIQDLAVARACHMTFGSYMTPNMPSDILTICIVVLNFLATFLMSMVIHASIGIAMHEAKVAPSEIKHIYKKGLVPYLTVLPEGLGFMNVPQIWTVLYFLACVCLLVNNLTIQIDAVQRSIADAHSSIRAYRTYILVALCSFCCIIGLIFTSKESFVISAHLFERVLEQIRGFSIFVMIVLTFWIYSVQRLSDDIHFLQGAQPTKFWKICWYITPCTVGLAYFHLIFVDETRKVPGTFVVMHYLSCLILASPIPICLFIEIFRYLKIHNLVGILQPEERWGPPDPEERHLRHLFNPRQEIRSRRRDDTCHHNCLLGSKYLKKVIAQERELREACMRRASSTIQPDQDFDTRSRPSTETECGIFSSFERF